MAPLKFSYVAVALSLLSLFSDLALAVPAPGVTITDDTTSVLSTPVSTKRPKCKKGITSISNTVLSTSTAAASAAATSLATTAKLTGGERMKIIEDMYSFGGFVYTLSSCPSSSKMVSDFKTMKQHGARTVITFEYCNEGTDTEYIGDVIKAAGDAGLYIIPLGWTMVEGGSFQSASVPRMQAVTKAVIANPGPVIAVAYGDEPLFDNDAGSADALASVIKDQKAEFKKAGLDMPVSISEMAYGWQQGGSVAELVNTLDFFMINNFPYYDDNAQDGGSKKSWDFFTNEIDYYTKLAKGKPLMVTMTGWPSNKNTMPSNNAQTSLASEQAYWKLLDSHCADYFKKNKLAWLWRSWSDELDGWGVVDTSGKAKFDFTVSATC